MRIISRTEWGGPLAAPGHFTSGPKTLVIIHHSYRPNRACGVSRIRERADVLSMHRYHLEQGWGGIGYNFLAFQGGNAYEGRGWGRTGAHTAGRNSSSVGICLVIDGTSVVPTQAIIDTVEDIIAQGISLGHISEIHTRAPHDQFQAKDCPGRFVKASSLLGTKGIPTLPDIIRARPTLRLGKGGKNADSDTVAAVRELQRRLKLKPEHQTGYFGPITDVAVREFQKASGLVVDGIVGPMTWAALGA